MFFLIRMAFWLTVIFALVPIFFGGDDPKANAAATKFSAGDAVNAATATMSDLGQFCTRRPETCAIGAQAAAAIGSSAQAGMKILYGYLQEKVTDTDTAVAHNDKPAMNRKPAKQLSADRTPTGSASIKASHDTLLPVDLGPAWRGPA